MAISKIGLLVKKRMLAIFSFFIFCGYIIKKKVLPLQNFFIKWQN